MVKAIFQKTKVAPGGTFAVLFPRIEFSSKHTFMLPPGATLNENEPKKSSDSNGSDEVAAQITGGSTSLQQILRRLLEEDENDTSYISDTEIGKWTNEEILDHINKLDGGQ